VLGGFGHLNRVDVKEARDFIKLVRTKHQQSEDVSVARVRALDVGAGQ
jgi:hypothetical protein